MLVDGQSFGGSWGRNFIINWFVAIQCKTIDCFIKHSWGLKLIGKGCPQNPPALIPLNNDDSTVSVRLILLKNLYFGINDFIIPVVKFFLYENLNLCLLADSAGWSWRKSGNRAESTEQ